MRVLVTGGAGFIGRWVVKKLLDKGSEVWVLDDLSNGSRKNIEEFIKNPLFKGVTVGKVQDKKLVENLFENSFDICIHCAAQINVQESIDDPKKSFDSNILGTYILLEETRKYNAKFVLIGTCMVYDLANSSNSINESHKIKPLSPYAASKIAAESLTESFYHSFGLKTIILRPFNTFGPFQKDGLEGGVVTIFIKNKLKNEPLKIFGSGNQTRDLLYVEDCAGFIVKASFDEKAVGEIFNAGSGQDISINELALMIVKDKNKINHVKHHHPQAEIQKLVCDYNKAKKILGWKPTTTLPDGIKKTEQWLREEYKNERA